MTVLLLVLMGLVALSLTRPAHQRQVCRRTLHPALVGCLRVAGIAALTGAAGMTVQAVGWVIGLALWCGGVTVCAALWTFCLPWLARGLYNRRT